MGLFFLVTGCSANDESHTGTITEMDVFENTGCILFKINIDGRERDLLVQGMSMRELKKYDDDIWHTWSRIENLTVNITSYHHTYPDNGLSDGLAYDEVEIWSSAGTDHRNTHHVAPTLSTMLPYQSCRFVGTRDRTLVWIGAPEKDYHLLSSTLQFTSSTGHDITNPVHVVHGP